MTKFSITELKKELDQKTKKELINEISNMYKKFPQVKEYYHAQYADSIDVLEKYVEIIEKEFVDGKTYHAGAPSFASALLFCYLFWYCCG